MIVSALVLAAGIAVQRSPSQPVYVLRAPLATLSLEVADTQAKRERGLMFRTTLPPHTGMIFVFEKDDAVEFWMKNTLISLDIVFVSAEGRVRSVAPDVPPATLDTPDDRIARVSGRAQYVLELPAGEAADDGLSAGVQLPQLAKRN